MAEQSEYTITGDPAADAKSYIDLSRADNARYLREHPEAEPIPEHRFAAAEAEVRKQFEIWAKLKPALPDLEAAPAQGGLDDELAAISATVSVADDSLAP